MNRLSLRLLVVCILILNAPQCEGQHDAGAPFRRVYDGADGLAHIETSSGHDLAIAGEPGQVGVAELALSPDRKLAGWVIMEDACAQSDPCPTKLEIYGARGKRFFSPGAGIVLGWAFRDNSKHVAIYQGFPHGPDYRFLSLNDIWSGKVLKRWEGDADDEPPFWSAIVR